MKRCRERTLYPFVVVCTLMLTGPTSEILAQSAAEKSGYGLIQGLMSAERDERREASRALIERGDPGLVAGIVDALFFIPSRYRAEAFKTLEALAGTDAGASYWNWVEWVGAQTEIEPAPGYPEWKVTLLKLIDERYPKIFYPGAPSRIRLEEVVTGGVKLGGIPSLDHPKTVPAAAASYLKPDEEVFGVDLGGEQRAYPLRFLDWHEMLNDEVGGEPITLSYCTLCGSGILYSTRTPNGSRYTFGTSGLLYRSNKLMFDRETFSLWSNLTGEPVIGRLARGTIQLEVLPLTRTTWQEWSKRHPQTTVVARDAFDGTPWGFDYRPGKADERRRGVSFPVWLKNSGLEREAEVYALRLDGVAKAYPLELVLEEGLVHDIVGERPVVLIADPESGAVRMYERLAGQIFEPPEGDRLEDAEGRVYTLTESRLEPDGDPELDPLGRLPGHISYWFGWYAFYPETELYGGHQTAP